MNTKTAHRRKFQVLTGPSPRPALADVHRIAKQVDHIERLIGGRKALVEWLSAGDSAPEVEDVLLTIADPANDKKPLNTICREAGISPGQLLDAVKAAAEAQGRVLGAIEVAKQTVATTKDFLAKAVDYTTTCPTCQGTTLVRGRPCKKCNGTGRLAKEADFDRQVKVFEMVGLLKSSGPGIVVNNQQNTVQMASGASGGGALSLLQQAVQEAMYAPLTLPEAPSEAGSPEAPLVPEGDYVDVTKPEEP